MKTFNCMVYTNKSAEYPLSSAPGNFWRKIELAYPDGGLAALVYDSEPDDPGELPDLMWQIQTGASRDAGETITYTITVTEADGTARVAPPIFLVPLRKGPPDTCRSSNRTTRAAKYRKEPKKRSEMSKTTEQIANAYRAMARRVGYRPSAPSDGLGNITVSGEQLDLERECEEYSRAWQKEEDGRDFHIGCCDFETRPATIYAVEAARLMCSVADRAALELLKMAIEELERTIARKE